MSYLAACAIFRNEAPYLREWIEFHRQVGAERFFLYDNASTDDAAEALAPYVAEGIATVHDWPDVPGQITAYQHCLDNHGDQARWIAFLDLDEFLFSPTLSPVSQVLEDFERHPGVMVNRLNYGSSGHKQRPEGLVIENYLHRLPDEDDNSRHAKSVVQPARTTGPRGLNPHCFVYDEGWAVNEEGKPIDHQPFGFVDMISFERLRINHYIIKSEEQWEAKRNAPTPNSGRLRGLPPERPERYSVEDDLITAYAPAVRAALAERDSAAAGS